MSRINKRFSLVFVNQDPKTHAAYKNMMGSIYNESTKCEESSMVKSAFQQYKNTTMKYPFGLSEQRFAWQDNNNKHKHINSVELTGTLSIKKRVKDSFEGGFESFYDLSQELSCDRDRNKSVYVNSSTQRKINENKNSTRVMNAKLDKTFGGNNNIKINKKLTEIFESSRSRAVGGISNLLAKTPEYNVSGGKRQMNSSFEGRLNIFSKDYALKAEPYVKMKKSVDRTHVTSGKFAGVNSSAILSNNILKNSLKTNTAMISKVKMTPRQFTGLLSQAKQNKVMHNSLHKNSTASTTILATINKKSTINSNYKNSTGRETLQEKKENNISPKFYNPSANLKRPQINIKKYTNPNKSSSKLQSSFLEDKSTRSNINDF